MVGRSWDHDVQLPKDVSHLAHEARGGILQKQCDYWSKGGSSPECEPCGTEDEYTVHKCRCRDPGWDEMFRISVGELQTWLQDTLGEETVSATVGVYLLARGNITMASCIQGENPDLIAVAEQPTA